MKTTLLSFALLILLAGCKSEDGAPVDAGPGTDLGRSDGGGRDLGSSDSGGSDATPADMVTVSDGHTPLDMTTLPTDGAPGDASSGAGETCSDAVEITEGTLTAQTTIGHANDYDDGAGCGAATGLDRVYTISVPNGQALVVSATPAETHDLTVNLMLLSACTTSTSACVVGRDSGAMGDAEHAHYLNTTGAEVEIAIIIDSFDMEDTGGIFDLTVNVFTPATPGDTCAMPTVIEDADATLVAETLTNFADQYDSEDSTGCTGMHGADHVYAVTLIPSFELDVTVTPTGAAWDPSLNIIVGDAAACLATTSVCAASADTGGAGDPDTLSYTNSTGLSQTVFIIIDSYNGAVGGYSLSTSTHFPL